jgi:hypothetical protein
MGSFEGFQQKVADLTNDLYLRLSYHPRKTYLNAHVYS